MTQLLINVKRELYVEGIGGTIDSGNWDKLEDNERLEGFKHLFLWSREDDVVIGRMWSSSDGKGRKRYPMIVCAHCSGLSLPWILKELPPRLEQIEKSCTSTESSSVVANVIKTAQQEIQALAQAAESSDARPAIPSNLLARLADRPEMGQDHQGLTRIMYQIEREFLGQSAKTNIRAKQLRVPACADRPHEAVLLWMQFLSSQITYPVPVLIILPLEESWVDMMIGEQVGSQLYSIRVLPSKLPMTTQIPYSLDEDFVQRIDRLISNSRSGGGSESTQQASQAGGGASSDSPKKEHKRSVFIKLIYGMIAVAVALVAGILFVNHSGLVDEQYRFDTASWIQWCVEMFY